VYAEPLAAGGRVVVLGDRALGLAGRFEQLGARQVTVAGNDDEIQALRGRTFDLVVVPDLGAFDDAAELLARARRLAGDDGAALVAAANRDAAEAEGLGAFDYYELFDLVAGEFAEVRMIGQMPFQGVALAELGEEEESPSVSVDTQLAEGDRAPAVFIALASQRGVRLDPYAIVELPEAPAPAPDTRELQAALADLAQERLRAQALQAQNDDLRERALRVVELERALNERSELVSELSNEIEEVRSAAEAGRVATAQVEELALRAQRAERALASLEPELARVADAHATELLRYEEALRDRAQAIRALEAELVRREKMVRELVGALEEHAAQPPPPPFDAEAPPRRSGAAAPEPDVIDAENAKLRARLDALALDLARREAEGQAAAWRLQELERQIAQVTAHVPAQAPAQVKPAASSSADLERKLATALDELDALRRALAQEHEARVRAESGEELTRARAEVQRQAALLRQLGREGDASSSGTEELR
jgi:hypothetical protein